MTRVSITGGALPGFLVDLKQEVRDRRELNETLALRFADELQGHFREKNKTPNRLGGKRTGFWNEMANATAVTGVDADGASVTVADQRFNIHVHGGTIKAKIAKALTIPLVAEAHGESVASYVRKTGNFLFRNKKETVLMEEEGDGVRPVYALRKAVTITEDPDALPSDEYLAAALADEAEVYLELVLP